MADTDITPEQEAALSARLEEIQKSAGVVPNPLAGYIIPDEMRGAYERAKHDGDDWYIEGTEYQTVVKNWSARTGAYKPEELPRDVGGYMTYLDQMNSGWQLIGVYPNGSGLASLLFRRPCRYTLPTPTPVAPPPCDAAPDAPPVVEDKAAAWAQEVTQ